MTATLKDFLKEKSIKYSCHEATEVSSKGPIYYVPPGEFCHPNFWCVLLAYTNLPVAKTTIVQTMHNAGEALEPSELKTKIASLSAEMTKEQLTALMDWAEPLRRGNNQRNLHSAFYATVKFLKTEVPEVVLIAVDGLVQNIVDRERISLEAARRSLYEYLHTLVDEAAWKGSYI